MLALYNGESHDFLFRCYRGTTNVLEDFTGSQVFLFLVGSDKTRITGTVDGKAIRFTLPSGIAPGAYDIEVIWSKNASKTVTKYHLNHDVYNYALITNAFSMTEYSEEATNLASGQKVELTSHVATYGYDGLSAYETAVVYGITTALSEKEYVQIRASYVDTNQIANGAITEPKIADNAVTNDKIEDYDSDNTTRSTGVTTAKISDGAVTEGKLAQNAVTESKIGVAAVTESKIGVNAVTEQKIGSGAVTTAKLHDGAVTEQKVGSGAVTESKIAANAVTGQKIADGAVSTAKLGDGSVTNVKIVDGAVGNSKIKDGTIENGKLAGGITNDKLAGGITADKLAGGITNEQLAGGITGDKLAAGSVSEGKLVDGSVSEDKIVSGAVSEDKIADGAVTTDKLALGAISDDKIADGALLTFETEQSEKLEELEGSVKIGDNVYPSDIHSLEDGTEFIWAALDNENKVLLGIRVNGNIYFGAGIPPQVVKYVSDRFSMEVVPLSESLTQEIALRNTQYSDLSRYSIDNPYLSVVVDGANHIIESIKAEGKEVFVPTEFFNTTNIHKSNRINTKQIKVSDNNVYSDDSTEFVYIQMDTEGKILYAIKKDGTCYIPELSAPIISSIAKRLDTLEDKVLSNMNIRRQAKLVADNTIGKFPFIKPTIDKDIYITLSGDSITAFQNVFEKDNLGVAAVPPTCDKKANCNQFWNAVRWGNAIYRRFDYGKNSLVGQWDETWKNTGDTQAFFTESGLFKTEYIGAELRNTDTWINTVGTGAVQVSTHIDKASFPYRFDVSEMTWWQRNIPKRHSNDANASVTFTIPAGYSKFDFLFHAHVYGDDVTITTNKSDGVVKVNTKQNDWDNSVNANNHVFSTNMSSYTYNTDDARTDGDSGNDAYGACNMRMYFKILDASTPTTITITKSDDTSKYFIYWGVTYWGTSALPYALHINNVAIGGYTQRAAWNIRNSMFKATNPDAVIFEICHNNITGGSGAAATVIDDMGYFKTYFQTKMGFDIKKKVGMWMSHSSSEGYRVRPLEVQWNNQGVEKWLDENGFNVIANFKKLIEDINDVYYPNYTRVQMMDYLGDVHLNYLGQNIYGAAWETLR